MLSRLFLILAGLFAGMWLSDTNVALVAAWFPWLALLAFAVALASAVQGQVIQWRDGPRRYLVK
jgi:hypothetical protein